MALTVSLPGERPLVLHLTRTAWECYLDPPDVLAGRGSLSVQQYAIFERLAVEAVSPPSTPMSAPVELSYTLEVSGVMATLSRPR